MKLHRIIPAFVFGFVLAAGVALPTGVALADGCETSESNRVGGGVCYNYNCSELNGDFYYMYSGYECYSSDWMHGEGLFFDNRDYRGYFQWAW